MPLQWSKNREEMEILSKIARRYARSRPPVEVEEVIRDVIMDVEAAHCNGCPLRLSELLAANDGDFFHDINGIRRHLDRSTGQLGGCFSPRYELVNHTKEAV